MASRKRKRATAEATSLAETMPKLGL
jgi:hypothetical protein